MPTKRTRTLIISALLLYFFANQTQIGWLYVMSALLAGIVLASWLVNRRMLHGIRIERSLSRDEISEGEALSIKLDVQNTRSTSLAQIAATEDCPLADSESDDHLLPIFVPFLKGRGEASLSYEVTVYKRGLHTFPPVETRSSAPFGFFRAKRMIEVPTRALVYPEVRPLRRLELLDRQPLAQQTRQRAGLGSEVMGVRPFRTGDSPRHVHWRSTARTGQLISKEFADDAHPGLTIVLDLLERPNSFSKSKHTPFEWGIKAAASIGEYAQRRGYSLHVLADSDVLPPPPGALSWSAFVQYLARIEPTGEQSLDAIMSGYPFETFVVVILPYPDERIVAPLVALKQMGVNPLAVVLDPASFPTGGSSGAPLVDALRSAEIEARSIRFGTSWTDQLSEIAERQGVLSV
jgi:uncharacterized protein (DUF58 family)